MCTILGQGDVNLLNVNNESVEVELIPSMDGEFSLETTAELSESTIWKSIMSFRGKASTPKNFIDPFCESKQAKFFRLKQKLSEPTPEVSNFRLLTLDDDAEELYYNWNKKGIVLFFTGQDVENALDAKEHLLSLQSEFSSDNILIWVISLSGKEDREQLHEKVGQNLGSIPVLQDWTHSVTRSLCRGSTPEAVLIDTSSWRIKYQGPMTMDVHKGDVSISLTPLKNAISNLVSDELPEISFIRTAETDSGINPVAKADYAQDIAPLLIKNCFPCHTEGDIAPWAMSDHGVIKEFSSLIKSSVLAGEMPPWHADPKYSAFSNSKSMSEEEISMLVDWIDRGSPNSGSNDPLKTYMKPNDDAWPMGKPDVIISIPRQNIPATGSVDYRYLEKNNPFGRDVWLKGVAVKPGNREVVHHCLVFKGTYWEIFLQSLGGLGGFFAGYVPGMEQEFFPEGTGKLLKKNDIIQFQMHYTTSGKSASDVTQLGLYLADEKPEKELVTSSAFSINFRIPPNKSKVPVRATTTFRKPTTLYEFSPHMHYRGSSAKYTLKYPDGVQKTILNVPAYFFDWQALYRLEKPISVPAGTQLRIEGTFDNTEQNRFNPDPNATVTFGEQSWEEMFIGYINYTQ